MNATNGEKETKKDTKKSRVRIGPLTFNTAGQDEIIISLSLGSNLLPHADVYNDNIQQRDLR